MNKRSTVHSFLLAQVLFAATYFSPVSAEQFTIAVLPDTQFYSEDNPEIFEAQTEWIRANRSRLDWNDDGTTEPIIYVAHLGDIVDDANCRSPGREWVNADTAMRTLDTAGIPYGVLPGNHDFDDNSPRPCQPPRTSNNYNFGRGGSTGFGPTRYDNTFYGPADEQFDTSTLPRNDNNFTLFSSARGEEFIAINLAFSNLDEPAVLDWADRTLKKYPNRRAIVTSHYIANEADEGGSCGQTPKLGTYGRSMWDRLKENPNLFLMLSGHCRGENYIKYSGTSLPADPARGRVRDPARACLSDVHVLMSNYQDYHYVDRGGNPVDGTVGRNNTGYLRLLRFDTRARTVNVVTYSPWIEDNPVRGPVSDEVFSREGKLIDIRDGGDISVDVEEMGISSASNFSFEYQDILAPSVVLLPDTSGSMGWGVDGTIGVPEDQQRITFARQAATLFVDLMSMSPNDAKNTYFGLATFPDHPYTGSAESLIDLSRFSDTVGDNARMSIDNDLTPEGSTPMLAGIETADQMLEGQKCKVVVTLSDGYHNVPTTATVGSTAVAETLRELEPGTDAPTRIFPVIFGGPDEVDAQLLQYFANQTRPVGALPSQFYDATTAITGGVFDTGMGLRSIFKTILSDVLGIEDAVDPIDVVSPGKTQTYAIPVGEHDNKLTFVVAWNSVQEGLLTLRVYDSTGAPVSTREPGVDLLRRSTHSIMTVDRRILDQPGRVGPQAWKLQVHHEGTPNQQEQETFLYSVLMESGLKFKTQLDGREPAAGDTIVLSAEVMEGRKPVKELTSIEVIVSAPDDGKGNWFAENKISDSELAEIPAKKGGEILNPILRKGLYLREVMGVKLPGRHQRVIRLYDDGSHGDSRANDGRYTNRFTDTTKEGVYSFYFRAFGPTRGGNSFRREDLIQKYLAVRPVSEAIQVAVTRLRDDDEKRFDVKVVPMDKYENYVGPGYTDSIKLYSKSGKFQGELQDNLDGSYTQTLVLDPNVDEKKEKIVLKIANVKKVVSLGELLGKNSGRIDYKISISKTGTDDISRYYAVRILPKDTTGLTPEQVASIVFAAKNGELQAPLHRHEDGSYSKTLKVLRKTPISSVEIISKAAGVENQHTIPKSTKVDPLVEDYQRYFKALGLPYMTPQGCTRKRKCELTADFNGDGTVDHAALYEYVGAKHRQKDWYLDLVIVYSSPDSNQPQHEIFSHMGRVNSKNKALTKIKLQKQGSELKLPSGIFKFETPAINVFQKGEEGITEFFPTIYWSGEKFYSVVKADD